MTFQIMTDSTSDLSQYYLKKNHIEILGMTVTVGNQTYETIGEEALDNSTLLTAIKKGATVHTSQINSGQFLEVFKKYALAEEELLYLAFSSGLSGTYQSALIAQNMILEEFPNAKITVIDTLAAASGEGFIVEEVVKLRDAGKSLTETLKVLADIIPRLQSRFMVDDLNHLARGGRIPKAVALVGTMANIKPLLDVDPAGFSPSAEATGDSSSPVPVSSEKTSSNPFDSFEISPMSPEESWLEPFAGSFLQEVNPEKVMTEIRKARTNAVIFLFIIKRTSHFLMIQ